MQAHTGPGLPAREATGSRAGTVGRPQGRERELEHQSSTRYASVIKPDRLPVFGFRLTLPSKRTSWTLLSSCGIRAGTDSDSRCSQTTCGLTLPQKIILIPHLGLCPDNVELGRVCGERLADQHHLLEARFPRGLLNCYSSLSTMFG